MNAKQLIEALIEAKLAKGDIVTSKVDGFGLKKGQKYKVLSCSIDKRGDLDCKVTSDSLDKPLKVSNADSVLKKVK